MTKPMPAYMKPLWPLRAPHAQIAIAITRMVNLSWSSGFTASAAAHSAALHREKRS